MDIEVARSLQLTVTVWDRFNYRAVVDAQGHLDELAPTDPVLVPPLCGFDTETHAECVQIQLYSHTHRDGAGWHYEWVSQATSRLAEEMLSPLH